MKKIFGKGLKKIRNIIHRLGNKISPAIKTPEVVKLEQAENSLQALRVIPWFKDNGDKTHRLNYDLNEDSVVFDLGGYEGQWAAEIFCKYNCKVLIFEPFNDYVKNIKLRFLHNQKVNIYDYGLTNSTRSEVLNISADSSSVFKKGESSVEIKLVELDNFLDEHDISNVDLIKINIEGGEFELLEYLVETDKVSIFKNIQVQFHDFVPDAINRMKAIQNKLSKTHALTYQYEFVWENWKLKNE